MGLFLSSVVMNDRSRHGRASFLPEMSLVIPDSLPVMQCMERLPGCLSSRTAATAPQMLTAKPLGAGQERAGPQDSARLAVKVCVVTTRGS